jgi:hypothetical protein
LNIEPQNDEGKPVIFIGCACSIKICKRQAKPAKIDAA